MLFFIFNFLVFFLVACNSARKMQRLPAFAHDYSELFIASVLERSVDDNELFVAIFVMGHTALFNRPQQPFLMINNVNATLSKWQKAAQVWKSDRIVDSLDSGISCKIKLPHVNFSYSAKAKWVPSRTSIDSGFNRHLEILRCKIPHSDSMYKNLRSGSFPNNLKNEKVVIEIIRQPTPSTGKATHLIKFQIPVNFRRTGYGFSLSRKSSYWDPWQGSELANKVITSPDVPYSQESIGKMDTLGGPVTHLCISFVRPLEPYRMDTGIVMFLENIEHNIRLGFDHIFIGINLEESSIHMQRFRLAMDSYIRQGKVSLSSMALPGYDDVAGILGTVLIDDYARWMHQQQCLYISKGMAEYVVLLQASEFLTVKSPMKSIKDLLMWAAPPSNRSQTHQASPERSQALNVLTSTGKRPCYYVVETLGVPDPPQSNSGFGPGDNYWTGNFFAGMQPVGPLPSWISLILPTSNVWMLGWHVCGACVEYAESDTGLLVKSAFPADTQHDDILDYDAPWSAQPVNLDHNAGVIPQTHAVTYFYKGAFEPWQLSKPRHPTNEHLALFAEPNRQELLQKGFSLRKDGMFTYTLRSETVKKLYPHYYYAGNKRKSLERRSGEKREEIMTVNLSSLRTQPWEATLPFIEGLSASRLVPVGKKGLLAEQTWMECNEKSKCQHPVDLLRNPIVVTED